MQLVGFWGIVDYDKAAIVKDYGIIFRLSECVLKKKTQKNLVCHDWDSYSPKSTSLDYILGIPWVSEFYFFEWKWFYFIKRNFN